MFSEEPPKFEGNKLIGRPDVICTPHLGASTTEAQEVREAWVGSGGDLRVAWRRHGLRWERVL